VRKQRGCEITGNKEIGNNGVQKLTETLGGEMKIIARDGRRRKK
jgi:hypothetical protein